MFENTAGDAIRLARGSKLARNPEEGIAGESFTLLEAGLMGPVDGVPGLEVLAPFPQPLTRVRPPEPEPWLERARDEQRTAEGYYTGQEMPSIVAGGGILGAPSFAATTNPQITADQNDYGIGAGANFRLSTDAQRAITGITGGYDGKFLYISNVGAFNLVLSNQNAGSAAANRIITGTGDDRVMAPGQSVILKYDSTDSRWRMH